MGSALSRPLLLLLSGSAAGLLLGVIASQLLAQIVYQATPRDPLVLAGVLITMAVLGVLATWIPAERSLHVHPARLLLEADGWRGMVVVRGLRRIAYDGLIHGS